MGRLEWICEPVIGFPQGGSPHGPQLSHRPRWRSHHIRRCGL